MKDLSIWIGRSGLMVLAWGFFGMVVGQVVGVWRSVRHRAQTMHQIPCTECRFFTNHPTLKCTVHPQIANTERAIACRDFSHLA